jgi:ribosomal protein S17E
MGKAMSNAIKTKAKIVLSEFKEQLGTDFTKNKTFLKKINLPLSKLTINLMAGYITRIIKQEKKDAEKVTITKKDFRTPSIAPKDKEIHG